MITPGRTYEFKDSGKMVMCTVKDVLTLDGGLLWVTTTDGEDYLVRPEELTEV